MIASNTTNFLPESNDSKKRGLLLLCIFLFPLIFTFILFLLVALIGGIDFTVISSETKFASIDSPINRSIVSKKFEISGSLNTPDLDHSYYLMEFRDNRYWPKYHLGDKAISWSKDLTFRAKSNQYSSYQVIMVDETLKQKIEKWFKTAQKTGKYPGVSNFNIKNIVANIRVKSP